MFASAQEPDCDGTAVATTRRLRVVSLAISVMLVLSQSMVAVSVFIGTILRSCRTSDDCEAKGSYCEIGGIDRCMYCGLATPLPWQTDPATGGTLNGVHSADYVGFNTSLVAEVCADPTERLGANGIGDDLPFTAAGVASWCETCMLNDGRVDDLTPSSRAKSNVAAMGPFDWIALIFSTVVVALTACGELKDIKLCAVAIRHAGDNIPHAWRFALSLLGGVRRWVFMPTMCMTVTVLVLFQGGDALSVCLNTVAVLFLCDIDNLAYVIGLGKKRRAQVEADGRVELDDVEANALMLSKVVHVCVLGVVIPCAVRLGGSGHYVGYLVATGLPSCAFWLAAVVEAVVDTASVGEACKEVGRATGRWLLGSVGFSVLAWAAEM